MPRGREQPIVSEDAAREFRELFHLYDKDRDGRLTAAELGLAMRSLGLDPSESELQEMLANAQVDSNGLLDCAEFVKLVATKVGTWDLDAEIRDAFSAFDRDGTGKISAEDLRHVLTSLGDELTDEEIQQMIRESEAESGGVNYADFTRVLSTAAGSF